MALKRIGKSIPGICFTAALAVVSFPADKGKHEALLAPADNIGHIKR
jgi:hypothetical protein